MPKQRKRRKDYPNQGKNLKPDKLQGRVCFHSYSVEKTLHVQHPNKEGHVKFAKRGTEIPRAGVSNLAQTVLYTVPLQRRSARHEVSRDVLHERRWRGIRQSWRCTPPAALVGAYIASVARAADATWTVVVAHAQNTMFGQRLPAFATTPTT